jgi:two-component system response regulator GlrR
MTEETPRPRILLVDDDAELLDLMQSRLLALGRFEVMAVPRAREVLSRLAELRPDLIVSDIDMPGMDGGSLAAALREREAGRRIPILFLSSMISVEESEAGHGQVGGWPMLSKKTPFAKLLLAIEQSLEPAAEAGKASGD